MAGVERKEAIPIVRCRLGGPDEFAAAAVRYVPLSEFGLWRYLMENHHRRHVQVEAVSIWIPEEAARWNSGFRAEDLEPVLRICLERPGPYGVPVRMERFFPAETYPRAQEAFLSHYTGPLRPRLMTAIPGYFLPASGGGAVRIARSA
jgi:hypothetical protein